ncbi:MAG: hypothetical protein GX230_05685 [Lentisphaerae bacterium]|jgi:hypothetical protein|nr:hypothetical protein [Lentisphaerota bacterium]
MGFKTGKWWHSVVALLGAVLVAAAQQQPSQLRAEVTIRERPSDPDLGVYLQLPDGGLLPKFPLIEVRDSSGQMLESLLLWHTPADALGLLFRPPANGNSVTVHISAARTMPPRPAATRLKPSLFVFTRSSGAPSLDEARRMAGEWPPAQRAYGGKIGRIGIRWNPYGADDNFVSWFTGWFKLDKREKIYFATISDEGSEVWLDGSLLVAWPGIHTRSAGARGEYGKSVTLEAGWHKIDYYHFEVRGDQEMCLVWRREGESGLPTFMEGRAWGASGQAEVTRITGENNRSVGWVGGNLQATGYLWLGEQPLNLHTLVCRGVTPGAGTTITWDFGGGRTVTGKSATWFAQSSASLTVVSAGGSSRQNFRMTSFVSPRAHSVNNSADRLLYRQVFLDMIKATAKESDPCAAWSGDQWTTLLALLEPYRGGPILVEIFERSWRTLQRLPVEQRHELEDRFAETMRLSGDVAWQQGWIDRFEQNDINRVRKFKWREERINSHLYYADNVVAARRAVRFMREAANAPEEIQRSVLLAGDVERMAGQRELAARHYAEAQERYRSRNRLAAGATVGGGGLTPLVSRPYKAGQSPNRNLPSLQRIRQELKHSDAWKLYAVNDAAQASTISAYLAQNAVSEALAVLYKWENDSPMSKIGGDYPMSEARVYAHVGDWHRTAAVLEAYRKADVMTSQLPEAYDLLLDALSKLKRSEAMKEIAEEAVKRFPGLPVANRAAALLRQ